MRTVIRLALLGSLVPLAGCMTSGTNMHGDFACRAPNGTCAPMSSIDAKAVAGLGATAQPIGGIVDPAMPREGRVVTASGDGTPPGRTADRVLRVVFPAHIDASGIYHDESSAHAVVERGAWTDGLTGGGRGAPLTTAMVVDHAAPEASESKLASLDEIISGRAAQVAGKSVAPSAMPLARPVDVVRTPVSLRSTSAIDLREAASAASAGPVGGLDPNFDTPDVSAVEAIETAPNGGTCVAYHMVRWHGHPYRRPFNVACPVVTAAAVTTGRFDVPALVPGSTAALNRAVMARTEAPVAVAAAAPIPAPTPTALATTPVVVAATGPAKAGSAPVAFAPTTDPKLAAARVSAMAAPVISEQIRLGRIDAKAATPPGLGSLFAGAGSVTSSIDGAHQ